MTTPYREKPERPAVDFIEHPTIVHRLTHLFTGCIEGNPRFFDGGKLLVRGCTLCGRVFIDLHENEWEALAQYRWYWGRDGEDGTRYMDNELAVEGREIHEEMMKIRAWERTLPVWPPNPIVRYLLKNNWLVRYVRNKRASKQLP